MRTCQRYLTLAPQNTLLTISRIPFANLRAACAQRGLMEGDRVSPIGVFTDHLLLRGPTGDRILVEKRLAALIEVEPAVAGRANRSSGRLVVST